MGKSTPCVVTVNGWSGSGKTTFSERLIAELSGRGYKVAAAKNSRCSIEPDKPGSDSKRFYNAGAGAVCLNAENSMTLFFRQRLSEDGRLAELFPEYDFIVAEGFRIEKAFRIEVTGSIRNPAKMKNPASEADLIIYSEESLATALEKEFTQQPTEQKKALLMRRDSVPSVADLLCS